MARRRSLALRNPVKQGTYLKSFICFINIFIVAACTGLLIYETKICIENYLKFETRAILSVKPTGDASFLAFTICPSYDDAYKKDLLLAMGSSKDQYKAGNFTVNATHLTPSQVFQYVTHELTEIMDEITLTTSTLSKETKRPKVSLKFGKNESNLAKYVTNYDMTFGRCYSVHLSPNVTALGVIKVEFTGKLNIYIYLHHPKQFLDVDSKTKVYADKGKSYFLDLAYEITENTLGSDETSILGQFKNEGDPTVCNSDPDYDFDGCTYAKIRTIMMQGFGCTVPLRLQKHIVDLLALTPSFENLCLNLNQDKLKDVMSFHDHVTSKRVCKVPCSTMEVFLGLLMDGTRDDDKSYIKLYLKSTVKYKKTVRDYTLLSMIAEIGGYEGLLLGLAIVNITYWIEKLGDRFIK